VAVNSKSRRIVSRSHLGCQIFLDTIYQNEGKYTKLTTTLPNGHKIYQMTVKYST
jgi:hypothetical protein